MNKIIYISIFYLCLLTSCTSVNKQEPKEVNFTYLSTNEMKQELKNYTQDSDVYNLLISYFRYHIDQSKKDSNPPHDEQEKNQLFVNRFEKLINEKIEKTNVYSVLGQVTKWLLDKGLTTEEKLNTEFEKYDNM